MQKLLLIDSDFLMYKVCYNQVLTETEIMYGIQNEKTLQETLDLIDWYLEEKIFKPTKADYYIGFLGGTGNYRYLVDKNYKAGRSTERPPYFKEAKQYLVDKYGFVVVDNIESEDAVGITLTRLSTELKQDYNGFWFNYIEPLDVAIIVVKQDHDLDQLTGSFYNPVTAEWTDISKAQADYNLYRQVISGCATDKVQGLFRYGKAKADKVLKDCTTVEELKNAVIAEYIKYYKDSATGLLEYSKTWDLIHILREKEDFIIPEIQSVNKQSVEQQIIPEF